MEIIQMTEIEKKVRRRYFNQSQSARECGEFDRREVRLSEYSWGRDWSAPSRSVAHQNLFANYISDTFPPEAIATLNTPKPLHIGEFCRRIELLRVESQNLHRTDCPSRRHRRIEYIAALEVGLNPRASEREMEMVVALNRRKASKGRVHAHVPLYNLHSIRLEDLAQRRREINQIKKLDEPLIQPYTPGPEGILYCLKSLGSDADNIILSTKWGHVIQTGKGPSPAIAP